MKRARRQKCFCGTCSTCRSRERDREKRLRLIARAKEIQEENLDEKLRSPAAQLRFRQRREAILNLMRWCRYRIAKMEDRMDELQRELDLLPILKRRPAAK